MSHDTDLPEPLNTNTHTLGQVKRDICPCFSDVFAYYLYANTLQILKCFLTLTLGSIYFLTLPCLAYLADYLAVYEQYIHIYTYIVVVISSSNSSI